MMERVTGKRKSRFHRSEIPTSMVLQDRDKRIIAAVYEYRFLSRSQIQRLFAMNCLTRANARLRKLFDRGYLDRLFRPTVTGTSQAIYTLGKAAIPLIAQLKDLPEKEIGGIRRQTLALSEHALEHDLIVNDFRIAIVNEVKVTPNIDLILWQEARTCEHRFEINNNGKILESSLRPDGYFRLLHQGKLYSFFLEIDRGTTSLEKLRAKFQTYLDFKNMGLYEQAVKMKTFYVLIVTVSPERAVALKGLTDRLSSDIFWFSSNPHIHIKWLTDPVWQRSSSLELRALFLINQGDIRL